MITLKRQFNHIVLRETRGNFLLKQIKLLTRFKTTVEFIKYLETIFGKF